LIYSAIEANAPENLRPAIGVTQLNGTWLTGDPAKANPRQIMTQLKIFPWRLLPGTDWTANWNASTQIQASGASFTDQGLQFTIAAGIETPTIGGVPSQGIVPGLMFTSDGSEAGPVATIRFTQPSVLASITALIYYGGGEITFVEQPQCSGDGVVLTPQSSWQDPNTQAWTLTFPDNGPAIRELTIPIGGTQLLLYSIDYSTAPVPMAILPTAPALYALKTVTRIEAARAGSSSFVVVTDGDPIVEFTYFQTAAGPGTAVGAQAPVPPAVPAGPAPFLQLAANCSTSQQPSSAFPTAGALTDLHTYTQWSWPLNGATAAYYGYDVNVEFVENYVNALYTAFSRGNVDLSLHFRCVDRNNDHTLLLPNAIHVPSIPQQSALAAGAYTPDLPSYLTDAKTGLSALGLAQRTLLEKRATQAVNVNALADATPVFSHASPALKIKNLNGRTAALAIQQMNPGLAAEILHELEENLAAQQAKQIWFKPLLPSTRYTLDVVAGPANREKDLRDQTLSSSGSGSLQGTLSSIIDATDAISLLAALQAYYSYEDSLTTLQRVQFTTSRYENFTVHLANASNQLAGATGATPIRNYAAAQDPIAWITANPGLIDAWATALDAYATDHASLSAFVPGFDPLADDMQPGIAPAGNGAAMLVSQRRTTAADWTAFSQASNALYDGLIGALGHPEMASNKAPIAVPDTEISLFTDATGLWVYAILIQSPEPLPWQRIWAWFRLTGLANANDILIPMWNGDGTNGLLLPIQQLRGIFNLSVTFQGNLGPELPCITMQGYGVTETAVVGPVRMGPPLRYQPRDVAMPARPAFNLPPALKRLLGAH
jgi:hypothetical protein